MKFSDFVSKYDNYNGRGVVVTNPYCENDFARNIEILGLESHGGIQKIYVKNEGNICTPMFLPDIWLSKINPESFSLDDGDIELLNLFEIKIGVDKESIENYLNGENRFIKIFPYLVGGYNISYVEPSEFNSFICSLLKDKPDKFEKVGIESDKLDKYINTDFDKYFRDVLKEELNGST